MYTGFYEGTGPETRELGVLKFGELFLLNYLPRADLTLHPVHTLFTDCGNPDFRVVVRVLRRTAAYAL